MRHTPPENVDLTPEMKAKLAEFREEHDGEPLGDVAGRVLFEDDRVRIWEMTLAPGAHSDLHRHDHDYYLLILSGDRVAGVPMKGAPDEPYIGKVPPDGNTVAVPRGTTEWAWNVGEETYHEFLIELKDT